VTVRVVSIREKTMTVQEGMREYYKDAEEPLPKEFPFRSKAMFVFQKQDGVDVCFFAMHVQEYGQDCPEPNRGRVYVSYLDSVYFFEPKAVRTLLYKDLLVGYVCHFVRIDQSVAILVKRCVRRTRTRARARTHTHTHTHTHRYLEFVKSCGFKYAHIWACPPAQGDDYIFHCHPPDQKVPKPKRLQDWYKDMLSMARSQKVIHRFTDMQQWVKDQNITHCRQFP
jgi:E1A/CREB-binding protein